MQFQLFLFCAFFCEWVNFLLHTHSSSSSQMSARVNEKRETYGNIIEMKQQQSQEIFWHWRGHKPEEHLDKELKSFLCGIFWFNYLKIKIGKWFTLGSIKRWISLIAAIAENYFDVSWLQHLNAIKIFIFLINFHQ